jgi:hypothetical protein
MNTAFQIGWSEADITPAADKQIELSGQYYRRLATGIHSRLKTVAVVFASGSEQAVMVSLDLVNSPAEFQQKVRGAVKAREPEIQVEKLFLNAVHTHNGPAAAGAGLFREWLPELENTYTGDEYGDWITPIIADNVVRAWRNRRPGGVARALGFARTGHCRRAVYSNGTAEMYGDTARRDFIGMEAGEDSGVDMLFTCGADGTPTGMLLNAACPAQVMEATYEVSSDFAGAARERLKQEYGENFHMIYQISPAGCQSPRDLVRHCVGEPDFWHADGVEVMAERLAEAVRSARLEAIDYAPVFRHVARRVKLPRRRVSYPDYIQAVAGLERLTALLPEREAFAGFCREVKANEQLPGRPGPYDSKLHHFVLIRNARAVIDRYEMQDANPAVEFDLNAVRIGEVAIANNPFELYLEFGQIIKARSRAAQTLLVQLSGGSFGYLPGPAAEKLGGYGGLVINGHVGSDGGYLLADVTADCINQLFAED